MSTSKRKQKLWQYRSLQNLHFQTKDVVSHKNSSKKAILDQSKMIKNDKKYALSRQATEANQKSNKKQLILKYNPFFSSPNKIVKQSKRQKHQQVSRNRSSGQQMLHDTAKLHSPKSPKFIAKTEITQYEPILKIPKKQKKPLKKEKIRKEACFQKSPPVTSNQIKSVIFDRHSENGSAVRSKSKQKSHLNKSKKKYRKNKINISVESTPSCLMSQEVQMMNLVDEGTFGKVFKGKHRKNGQTIAIKKVLQDSKYKNRQLQIINMIKNEFVVEILGSYVTYESGQQYLNIIMPFYEENLFHRINFYKKSSINFLQVKIIIYQLFKGLSYLHSLGICHRDIKPENILLKGCQAAICDFGSAKILDSRDQNISYICARCYRAPQLIFGATHYTPAIDVWSAGCVILELLNGEPLFIGQTSISHLQEIMKVMGSPTQQEVFNMNPNFNINLYRFPSIKKVQWKEIFPEVDRSLLDLIETIMVYDPAKRPQPVQILAHQYFDEIRDFLTFQHLKSQYRLKDFFKFSPDELRRFPSLRLNIIPEWYNSKKA